MDIKVDKEKIYSQTELTLGEMYVVRGGHWDGFYVVRGQEEVVFLKGQIRKGCTTAMGGMKFYIRDASDIRYRKFREGEEITISGEQE